ncbi:M23 family metallopeptidase [Thalassolituus oleivorans]|uniref:M23 family metallopeptidase n=1 Tax=Thalassolituus oleivorans TaxID=187493 RepID=UPI0023F560EC|nr:M23 family metallopeptidase [Thalassolituus oleivorans]
MKISVVRFVGMTLLVIFIIGFLIPENRMIPVQCASSNDWNKDTFWYEPWGTAGVHKGIDVFAKSGTPVLAPTNVWVLYQGELPKGGKVVVALGPKWRLHYFAHLAEVSTSAGAILFSGDELGSVGDTGNAQGKQPHLHYSIVSLIPLPWLIDGSTQGFKKAFYMNPIEYLN